MLKNTFEEDRPWLWKKFQSPVFPEECGMEEKDLEEELKRIALSMKEKPQNVVKAHLTEYIVRNVKLCQDEHDFFPSFGCWDRMNRPVKAVTGFWSSLIDPMRKTKALHNDLLNSRTCNNWVDTDHSVPDWDRNILLGFPGMLEKVREAREIHRKNGTLTPKAADFFEAVEHTYENVLVMLDRLTGCAQKCPGEKAPVVLRSLETLRRGKPETFFDALQFIYLYFIFGEHIDNMQVRSLGNLDNLLLPYFENDLKNGTFTEEEMRMFFDYFLMQWASIDNYWGHPFYLGGTAKDGSSRINKLSYLILEEFDKLSIPTPKIQLKIAKNTPDEFLNAALQMIRKGNNSLVFVSEEGIGRVFRSLGRSDEEARSCFISGCYEFAPSGDRTGNGMGEGHLNLLKPFEWIFHCGIDQAIQKPMGVEVPADLAELGTFEDFFALYAKELEWIIEKCFIVGGELETLPQYINPGNFFSGAITNSLKVARDAYQDGCYYNNTTILQTGLGSAVDALSVIREFVYNAKKLTLAEFAEILHANWKGHERFRAEVMAFKQRWGNGIPEVDALADRVVKIMAKKINGHPNNRGGIWELSGHCARQFIVLGERTMATPDGRMAGEEMSKNISPVMGMDVSGITAVIRSAMSLDATDLPADMPLDMMIHPSAISGEDGITAVRTAVRTYLRRGLAIHFNVFDPETLKSAQREPEKYKNLQIRVCGWNVRFTTLDKKEQDMYISRAEQIAE